MKFISTKVHGLLDYFMGIALMASPWIFGFAENGAQLWVPVILGAVVIMYSLMTKYEYGLSDNIRMRTHLVFDFIGGALLAASPWLFGFADIVFLPHLILGILEIGAAAFTRTSMATTAGNSKDHMPSPGTENQGLRHTRTAHG
jgi:hypothetical protein